MKIYKIAQTANENYDTYDVAIVAAKDENEAREIVPGDDRLASEFWNAPKYPDINEDERTNRYYFNTRRAFCKWAPPEYVTVELIGTAKPGAKRGVILASFNAG